MSQQQKPVHIRWMIRRDHPEVLAIETASFKVSPWSQEDLLCCLRQTHVTGMVGEVKEIVVGYLVYELCKNKLNLLNFAVHPDWRRRTVGTQMIQRLIQKLHPHRRRFIRFELRESNLGAQLFFRSQGFRAVDVLRRHFDDTGEDAYQMQYRARQLVEEPVRGMA